jgi:folate-binding protein YgfZ
MLANFRLLRRGGTVYLQMPRENVAAILKRLSMFKLMAKVDVADASDTSVCIGVAGTAAENLLSAQTGKLPQDGNGAVVSGDFIIVRLPGETPRFQVLGPAESTIALWRALAADATPDHVDRWALEDIRAGLPMVFGPTVEAFVPQMTNMQLVDGLSFNKGCYTGQEVVARMQYLGKLKRRMYRARIDADTCPAPGAELVSSTSTSGQGTGRVVDARPAANGTCELLVVAEIAAVESNDVQLGDGGPALQFLDLPYAFEAPK